ncbi:MAG: class I SAM-dependent methyltransferase [Clostridia bacterium]|nr:class I SAM-dependent methyltransferase [Clostridia bacterium]
MVDLLDLQKSFILAHLKPGDTAVDYTMGNGHDTAFLSQTVGETGKVYAFDVQTNAINSSRKTLEKEGCPHNYTLIHASHHRVKEFVPGKVKAGMFNLGYLPGSDKKITTMHETTLLAIDAAIELMDSDAIVLIAVYPGHAEGELEGRLVHERLEKLDRRLYTVACFKMVNSPTSPFFCIIEGR